MHEERRVITVLFADVVGYTRLSEHLDPERVKRLIDGSFAHLIPEIDRFGGQVDKVMGDGILALFGAPISHEDDPDRAVRAAIEMHRSLAEYMAMQDDLVDLIRLRVGINTGEVVVGTVSGTDDYTALGDAVNVASRLQVMASPGSIFIGASTEDQLSFDIRRELVADAEVRGRQQTERVWRVLGRSEQVQSVSSQSDHDVGFVGRTVQRELFDSVLRLVVGGSGAVIAVSGEAGSGKTRLVEESVERFHNHQLVVFAGRCAPYGESNVWAPVADAIYRLIGLDRGAPPHRIREIVRQKGLELYGFNADDSDLHRFVEGAMHLFGHPSDLDRVAPIQARELLFQFVVEGIRRRSMLEPLIVWLDDVQWADSLLIDLLKRLARSLIDRPVLIVTSQRDESEIDWPDPLDHPLLVRMPLEPLSRSESRALVSEVLNVAAPVTLAEHLYERSGGNPLFLTQLAQIAREDPSTDQLPGSLRSLVAARLDRLNPGERALIDNASVLGVSGSTSGLERFAEEMNQTYEAADLSGLVEDGLLMVEEGWWRFRSDVVREVAYQTLTKSARAQRHAGTALVMHAADLASIDQIAHHAASAAELVAELGMTDGVPVDIRGQAIDWLLAAAVRALEFGAFNQVIRLASRGLALNPSDDIARRLLLLRAEAAAERREGETVRADAHTVLEGAMAADDLGQEAIARRLIGVLAQQSGDLDVARIELDRSVTILTQLAAQQGTTINVIGPDESAEGPNPNGSTFPQIDVQRELVSSLSERGFVEVFGGSLKTADRILGDAERLAERLPDRRQLAWVRQHQAWVSFLAGDLKAAEARLEVSSGLFEDLGDHSGSGWASGLLAYLRFFARRFDEAERLAVDIRNNALSLGEKWAPAMMDSLLASIRLWSGLLGEAEDLSRRALTGFRELGDRFGIVQALVPRMRTLAALGRDAEAHKTMEEALSLADAFGDLAIPTLAAAGTAAHLGLGERAVTLSENGLHRLHAMHAESSEARITLALGLCQTGDPTEALAQLVHVAEERPYSHAVRSVALAMIGDADNAMIEADLVDQCGDATYLDRVIAEVVTAGAWLSAGGDDLEERVRERLDRGKVIADQVGDAVAQHLVAAARMRWLGDGTGLDTEDRLGPGWVNMLNAVSAHHSGSGSGSAQSEAELHANEVVVP